MTREMILKIKFPDLPTEYYPLYFDLEDKFVEYGISAELTKSTGYGYNIGDYRICPFHYSGEHVVKYHVYKDGIIDFGGTANVVCEYIKEKLNVN